MTLYEQYAALCLALKNHECESCGGPAQHVDPDGSTWCFECVKGDTETVTLVVYSDVMPEEEDEA